MSVRGADIERMTQFATTLGGASNRLETILSGCNADVGQSNQLWVGPDGNQFRTEWQNTHYPYLRTIASALEELSSVIVRNRDSQIETSADAGAGLGGFVGALAGSPAGAVIGDVIDGARETVGGLVDDGRDFIDGLFGGDDAPSPQRPPIWETLPEELPFWRPDVPPVLTWPGPPNPIPAVPDDLWPIAPIEPAPGFQWPRPGDGPVALPFFPDGEGPPPATTLPYFPGESGPPPIVTLPYQPAGDPPWLPEIWDPAPSTPGFVPDLPDSDMRFYPFDPGSGPDLTSPVAGPIPIFGGEPWPVGESTGGLGPTDSDHVYLF